MKVVCVYPEKFDQCEHHVCPKGIPIRNHTYTVIGQHRGFNSRVVDCTFYELAEKPVGWGDDFIGMGWESDAFVPLQTFQEEFKVKETIEECIGVEV